MNAPDDLDLDAIEQRAAAAPPGPWTVRLNARSQTVIVPAGSEIGCVRFGDMRGSGVAFIAAARDDVPALVNEVRRLREALRIKDGEKGNP